MEVILLDRIQNLGDLGDTVRVKPGYGRNYLLPQGKALRATKDNAAVFEARKAELLKKAADSEAAAKARAEAAGVTVKQIPSPGLVTSGDHVEPASYANFAITSHLVVVPTFGSPHDADGVAAVAELFPDRATIGLPGDAVLAGGGGFHCASQQMPAAGWRP